MNKQLLKVGAGILLSCIGTGAWAQADLISVDSNGAAAAVSALDMTPDGRFVVFASNADGVVPGHTSGYSDVFLRDRTLHTTTLVSVSSGGVAGNSGSFAPRISADGRYVVFISSANNLVAGDANSQPDVFVRDLTLSTTTLVSLTNGGGPSTGAAIDCTISDDGQRVAFTSIANNLVAGTATAIPRVYVRDLGALTTVLASVSTGGVEANTPAFLQSISGDGTKVLFRSDATNLSADTNGVGDLFVRDLAGLTTANVSHANGTEPLSVNGASFGRISRDGRWVVMASWVGGSALITRRDLQSTTWDVVSRSTLGTPVYDVAFGVTDISTDGRYVAFITESSLVAPDTTGGRLDAYVRDMTLGTTRRMSMGAEGVESDSGVSSISTMAVSSNGALVAYATPSTNLGFANPTPIDAAVVSGIPTTTRSDLVFTQNSTRYVFVAPMNGNKVVNHEWSSQQPSANWFAIGAADFNRDGKSDMLYQHGPSRLLSIAYMDGPNVLSWAWVSQIPNAGWTAVGVGDFTNNGKPSIIYQHTSGAITIGMMDNNTVLYWQNLSQVPNSGWRVAGVADMNGDGYADVIFQHNTAYFITIGYCQQGTVIGWQNLSQNPNPGWNLRAVGLINGDSQPDLVFQHQSNGALTIAYCTGATVNTWGYITTPGAGYTLIGAGRF